MSGTALFEVLEGGLLTTIQDAGRPEATRLGVPVSGAADPWSLAVANLLVGNDAGAAALELTIAGPRLRALRPATIAIAGADLGGRSDGRRLGPGRSHRLAAGDEIEFGGGPGPRGGWGARSYLAIAGGFEVEEVLGSRSTCLAGGFGGLDGRPLRAGDVLMGPADADAPEHVWPARADDAPPPDGAGHGILRVLRGPDAGLEALVAADWRVAAASDRVGTRLDGPALPDGIGGETTTFGVPWGAIQVPPDGRPIVLGPDHQTTGGYRVVGVVISADLPVLAQLGPGSPVRFVETSPEAAIEALRARRAAVIGGAAALRDDARWTALAEAAGG